MKIEINYSEIHDILLKAADKDLQLGYVSENTCSANISLPSVPFLGQPLSASLNVIIEKIEDTALYITLGGIPGIEMLLPMVMGTIENKLPNGLSEGFIEKAGGASLILHLEKIERFRRIFEKVTLQSVTFSQDAVILGATFPSIN